MKKVFVLLFTILAISILTVGLFSIEASAETEGYYTYAVSGGKATITDVKTSISGDVVIPSALGGYPVTSINSSAFEGCTGLTSVTIGNRVTSIAASAFENCTGLNSISVKEGNLFYHSKDNCLVQTASKTLIFGLKNSVIPADGSVTSIGFSAFANCTGLTSITIPDSVTSIGSSAFFNCKGLTSVTIPDSVTSIGGSAFSYCTGLTTVTLGDSVKSIGDYAFSRCTNLTSITIPDSVTSIGDYTFSNCNISKLMIAEGSEIVKESMVDDFKSTLQEVFIPDSVTSIDSFAFSGCTGLTSITIPDSVTSIGGSAFSGCTGLTSVTIPDAVTSIGYNAFRGCTGLTTVDLGKSVTGINPYTFYDCTNLSSVTIPDSVTYIGEEAFLRCRNLTSITIPGAVRNIGYSAFFSCNAMTSVTIGSGVKNIGREVFRGCTGLTSITIPDSVESIGYGAFYGCTGLISITLPFVGFSREENGTVEAVFGYIFGYDFSPKSGTTQQYHSSVGTGYFYYIPSSLRSVTITDATQIPFGAFFGCKKLTSITLGNSVETISGYAFSGCTALIDVWYEGSESDRNKISIVSDYNQSFTSATWHYNSCIENEGVWTHTYDNDEDQDCNECGFVKYTPGDLDGVEGVSSADAIYLLYYTLFGEERYPVDQPVDYDGDGSVSSADAIYLLYYTLFGEERYPI